MEKIQNYMTSALTHHKITLCLSTASILQNIQNPCHVRKDHPHVARKKTFLREAGS